MEVLKLKIFQKNANYRIKDSVLNRMTSPLPSFSMVVGAIHNACNWTDYHEMQICIQGQFGSMSNDLKKANYLFNSKTNDRGTFIKISDDSFSPYSCHSICASTTSQGSNFEKGIKTRYYNKNEYENYLNKITELKNCKNKITEITNEIKKIKSERKDFDKNTDKYQESINEELLLKQMLAKMKDKKNDLEKKIAKYTSMNTAPYRCEVLNSVNLVLYIHASTNDLKTIYENIYNLTSIGRSEDFIDLIDCEIINLKEDIHKEYNNKKGYNSYIDYDLVKNNDISIEDNNEDSLINATVYRINKDYVINNGRRIFNKKKVVYASEYSIEENCKNVYIDDTEKDGVFIVNLL